MASVGTVSTPQVLAIMDTIGIDLGGTTFNAALVSESGAPTHNIEKDTFQHDGPERLLPRIAQVALQVLEDAKKEGAKPKAVGIGVPGPIKHREGVCVYAPNLEGWKDLQVAAPLSEQIGLPVHVINDAKAATLAEARFGAGRGSDSILMLTLGTGIGSGLTIGGKLHLGTTDRGSEVGHITVDINDKRGSAGNVGTLEAMCGRDAIVWRAIRHLTWGTQSSLILLCDGDLNKLSPKIIAEAAQQGDKIAIETLVETASYLAVGITNVILTVDVERVVIGGGVAQAGEVLFEPLKRAVAARTSRMKFDVEQIVPAQLGPEAGVVGAAQWAREQAE
jgi:glucokinase